MGKMKEVFIEEREAQAMKDRHIDDAYQYELWKLNYQQKIDNLILNNYANEKSYRKTDHTQCETME